MAKRLTDTEIWSKEWFLKLTDLQRNLFLYIKDKCDCAGVYEPNYMLLNFIFKTEIKEEDFLVLKQVVKLPNGNFFITDFINFQYLSPEKPYLNPSNNAHRGVIKCLLKNKIEISPYLAPSEPLVSPYPGALDKDKDKDKDISSSFKDGGVGEETFLKPKKDLWVNPEIDKCFKTYKSHCPDLIPLSFEKKDGLIRQKLSELLGQIDNDVGTFERLCKEANDLKTIKGNKIDFKSLITNYIRILNGQYKEEALKLDTERSINGTSSDYGRF